MKFAVLAMFIAISLVAVSARRPRPRRCSSSDDCNEDECCLSRTILGFRKGDCRPLAKAGDRCSADEDELFGGRYVMHCPCDIGLSCKPTKEKDLGVFGKLKFNERCVKEPTSVKPETEGPNDKSELPEEITTSDTVSETEVLTEGSEAPVEETEAPIEETEAPAEE